MKVVINECFGGFSLSHEGMLHYLKLKGHEVFYEPDKKYPALGLGTYWIVPPEKRPKPIEDWSSTPIEERRAYNEAYKESSVYCGDIDRDDPALIQTVEELGAKADGRCAKLKIVEIPDGIDWHISEYDGNETVEEAHRSWS